MRQRPQDRIKYRIEMLAHIFRQKSKHEVPVLSFIQQHRIDTSNEPGALIISPGEMPAKYSVGDRKKLLM